MLLYQRSDVLLFFPLIPHPTIFTLFPYTTLFRSHNLFIIDINRQGRRDYLTLQMRHGIKKNKVLVRLDLTGPSQDRKSTRLNSSHVAISYAVFCLKKKKNDKS